MMNFFVNMPTTRKNMLICVAVAMLVLSVVGGGVGLFFALMPDDPPATPAVVTEPTVSTSATVPDETLEATLPTEFTEPVTEPMETEPAETVPETVPAVTEPAETVPETVPATEPVVTEPEETEPKPTEPVKPTEPKPTDPPKETQPKPTEPPKETQPKPTEPPKTHTHSYKAKVVEPTCEEKGYTVHTCSCGDSYTDSETPALGHDMHEDVADPGVGYEGYTFHYCSRCDYSFKDNFTEALPEVTAEDVQKAIIKYINQYRAAEGSTQLTYLPGMTQVAKYRSKQLTTNFAHDVGDIREALAHYEYGEWLDPADYGVPDAEGYWSASTQEAIGYGYYSGTADEIGQQFAQGFRNSSGHWAYVSSSEYSYTGVGVTKSGSRWYVCVMVGRVNYG